MKLENSENHFYNSLNVFSTIDFQIIKKQNSMNNFTFKEYSNTNDKKQ